MNHYEIIGTSKLPHYHLKHIVNHLQVFLNKASLDSYSKERIRKVPEPKPRVDHDEVQSLDQEDEKENNIEDLLSELKEASNSSQVELVTFFSAVLGRSSYVFVPETKEYVENLFLFTANRLP